MKLQMIDSSDNTRLGILDTDAPLHIITAVVSVVKDSQEVTQNGDECGVVIETLKALGFRSENSELMEIEI